MMNDERIEWIKCEFSLFSLLLFGLHFYYHLILQRGKLPYLIRGVADSETELEFVSF
jgi:hypothetical protein